MTPNILECIRVCLNTYVLGDGSTAEIVSAKDLTQFPAGQSHLYLDLEMSRKEKRARDFDET
jgi:hypothetical protein